MVKTTDLLLDANDCNNQYPMQYKPKILLLLGLLLTIKYFWLIVEMIAASAGSSLQRYCKTGLKIFSGTSRKVEGAITVLPSNLNICLDFG